MAPTKSKSKRINEVLAKTPPIEKLNPQIYNKLQSTIHETVEKTMPQYKKWLNSEYGKKVVTEDCPVEICSSCGNDCPVEICSSCGNDCPVEICSSCGNDCPVEVCGSCGTDCKTSVGQVVGKVTNEDVHAAMTGAIRYALKEASRTGGKEISEAKMRAAVKKQLMKAAKEIGKGK